MDQQTLAKLRKALQDREVELEQEINDMAGEIKALGTDQADENGGMGNSVAEDGTSLAESERLATFSGDLAAMLGLVKQALARMDEGTYGICLKCEKVIDHARLEAFPYVPFCITCQSEEEKMQAFRSGR